MKTHLGRLYKIKYTLYVWEPKIPWFLGPTRFASQKVQGKSEIKVGRAINHCNIFFTKLKPESVNVTFQMLDFAPADNGEDITGVLKADRSLWPSSPALGIVVKAKFAGLEGLLRLLGQPGAKACRALVLSALITSRSDNGGSAAACCLVVFMFEVDFAASLYILETLLFLCFFGREICVGGKSLASMRGRSCNGGGDINRLSLAAFLTMLYASQRGFTGWPSTAVVSVGEIGAPLVEDELVESGMAAIVAMANVPFSFRLL